MHHRIGAIADPNAEVPRTSASAHIQSDGDGGWAILENGEIRATYPSHAIRLSVVWKAAVRDRELKTDNLTLDRIVTIFTADLRHRSVDFQVPSDPLADTAWILLLQRIYADPTDSREDHVTDKDLEEGAKSEGDHQAMAGNGSGNGGVGNVTIFDEAICE